MDEAGGHETPQRPALHRSRDGERRRLSALWFAAMPASRSSRSGQWRAGQGPAGRAAAIGTPREQHSDPPHVILQCRPDSMHSINVPAALVGRAG
ncbi:hypothetical protein VTN96DRAFT_4913 [Rasamsonia emersonii]